MLCQTRFEPPVARSPLLFLRPARRVEEVQEHLTRQHRIEPVRLAQRPALPARQLIRAGPHTAVQHRLPHLLDQRPDLARLPQQLAARLEIRETLQAPALALPAPALAVETRHLLIPFARLGQSLPEPGLARDDQFGSDFPDALLEPPVGIVPVSGQRDAETPQQGQPQRRRRRLVAVGRRGAIMSSPRPARPAKGEIELDSPIRHQISITPELTRIQLW